MRPIAGHKIIFSGKKVSPAVQSSDTLEPLLVYSICELRTWIYSGRVIGSVMIEWFLQLNQGGHSMIYDIVQSLMCTQYLRKCWLLYQMNKDRRNFKATWSIFVLLNLWKKITMIAESFLAEFVNNLSTSPKLFVSVHATISWSWFPFSSRFLFPAVPIAPNDLHNFLSRVEDGLLEAVIGNH